MIKRAILPIALFIILLATNLFWFGKYIDSSLTIDSLEWDIHYRDIALSDLKTLFLSITVDTQKEDLKNILINKLKNPEIFEKNGNIYYENLGFIFENDKLIKVTTEVPFNPDSKG